MENRERKTFGLPLFSSFYPNRVAPHSVRDGMSVETGYDFAHSALTCEAAALTDRESLRLSDRNRSLLTQQKSRII
ncbi:MAG: hypothetical protein LBG15_11895 [Dysgonamonadaceae bacterium]|jgi:hypothetical protein|nr:hypothetical protein [Dysgonamonadaceae bacterium]